MDLTGTRRPLARGGVSLRLYPHDLGASSVIARMRAQAALAAEAGYDGVMVSEHHAGYPGYLPTPIQIAGMLLEAMPRGWVAPCPLLLPMAHHVTIAEQIAWLQACHPGRVGAGFAAGAVPGDFELVDVPFEEIGARFKRDLPRIVAALRGAAGTPLGDDLAIRGCAESPVPMVVAAQSRAAVRRAARLDLGVLFDSLQTPEATAGMVEEYRAAGGRGPCILIRRVWIGDVPEAALATQMQRYRRWAPERATRNWDGTGEIAAATAGEAAAALAECLAAARCDTVNVRIHLAGLSPVDVDAQLAVHATEFLPELRRAMDAASLGEIGPTP